MVPAMRILLTTLHSRYSHASLALPCLAAYCAAPNRCFAIREFSVNQPKDQLLADILACEADVIGFSVYLWNRLTTLELVHSIRQIRPRCRLVLGGPDMARTDASFFKEHPVDAVICGEGEVPLQHLLQAWTDGIPLSPVDGLLTPACPQGSESPGVDCLDLIPSPFALGLVDVNKPLVYYESSRGCPYRCSFCLSATSTSVRSFSMERIKADLGLLMAQGVGMVKFVDRTFNCHPRRAREIWTFILEHNRSSSFHFEIGAHLLDEDSMALLEQVPAGLFQFEIGVQSTLPATLRHIGRESSLDVLAANVRQLRTRTRVHLHLDLVAGLPGENFAHFLQSVDWTHRLGADHVQIELVKLLPGTPLRRDAEACSISFDRFPPYQVLQTREMSYEQLEELRRISRLNDLLVNSGKFRRLMRSLEEHFLSLTAALRDVDACFREQNLYGTSRSLRDLAGDVANYLAHRFGDELLEKLREDLSRDYARNERVVAGSAPDFYNTGLSPGEREQVAQRVKGELQILKRSGKIQYFAAVYHHLEEYPGRRILVFLYVSKSGEGMDVRELML